MSGTPKGTKYGKQPFLGLIQQRKVTYRSAAKAMRVPYLHLRHAGYGYVTAKYELREALAAYLGLPLEDLFLPESLAAVPHYGPKGRESLERAKEPAEPSQ